MAKSPEQVVADALSRFRSMASSQYASRLDEAGVAVEALRDAGYAVVELPDEMTNRSDVVDSLRGLPMWTEGDAWACLREPSLIEFEADGQELHGEIPTHKAVDLAAALLAAESRALKDMRAAQ